MPAVYSVAEMSNLQSKVAGLLMGELAVHMMPATSAPTNGHQMQIGTVLG